jgi:uncharacterized membrane protein
MYRHFPPPDRFEHRIRPDESEAWWWLLGNVLWMLVLAALVAGAVLLAMRLARRSSGPAGVGAPPLGAGAAMTTTTGDRAAEELRLRYARGDISRDEYLRTAADLGVPVPRSDAPPPSTG